MFKKIAIVRATSSALNITSYNIQEIGLAKGLLENGISTDIYSKFSNLKQVKIIEEKNGNHIKLIPIHGITFLNKISIFPGLIKKVFNNNYDLIQIHEESQILTPFFLKKASKNGIKCFLFQGMYEDYKGFSRIIQIFFDFFLKPITIKYSKVVLAKTNLAKKYLENKGYSNVLITKIGLDFSENACLYTNIKNVLNFKNKFSELLLYVGIIEDRRNPLFIVKILDELINARKKSIGIIIVGNGPLLQEMKNTIKIKQLENNFLFIKSIPNTEIHSIYKEVSVTILPSNYEIYGMVVLEALYNGIPVISTPTAGPIDILNNNKYGTCLELDIKKWSDKIEEYLVNKSNKNELTDYIKNNFAWNSIAQKYISILSEEFNKP